MNKDMPLCPICRNQLSLKLAKGRKSNKPFVMLICIQDGRHFRAFITYKPYVEKVLESLEHMKEQQTGCNR
jgi:hypothetical protein